MTRRVIHLIAALCPCTSDRRDSCSNRRTQRASQTKLLLQAVMRLNAFSWKHLLDGLCGDRRRDAPS
ncbi:hypothetical protein [Psittacid alphaherpesvirus 5]|uniref:Uncharacterized protein n=1 Tax=Psittacid alphaherpesvirus 5 TaxID=2972693 RepID=A0A5P9JTF9_9ALPH|nr:hypothetical protein QKU09_gp11 [Psittacid alphaherpesvirus 5]QFU14555.1 hypothetical protein [Psittacid alphaherpesvirus 5]UOO01026.1 hypothetical protein [Psittacid alphaherpesvirus 5]